MSLPEKKKLLTGEALESRCKDLGIDMKGEADTGFTTGYRPRAADYELQRRVIETERSIRESRLWIVALISAIASILSAAAAIVAVATR